MTTHTMDIDYKKYLSNKRSCVLCNGNNFKLWCRTDIFDILECTNCSL